jgi:hypothetical protein
MLLTGGCFCGAIRYEVTDTARNLTLCHCQTCRHVSGAPNVAWFTVSTDAFALIQGAPRQFHSSEHVVRTFCGDCGSPLTYARDDGPAEIDVTMCTLDDPEALAPADQTFCQYRLSWVPDQAQLRAYQRLRSEG